MKNRNSVQPFAFTLVELMVVMSVIVVLVGLMFPVVIGMRAKARNRQALVQVHSIALALKAYRSDFGAWPNQTQAGSDSTYFTNNHLVVRPLMGINPRGRSYLAVQMTNQIDQLTNALDPWGVPFVICLDENADGSCLISGISNRWYYNSMAYPPVTNYYRAGDTNALYPVTNVEVAVASFAGVTNLTKFAVESWSAPQ